jgi:alkylation response protein AidB-like acyl-CoA dehydrogenase
MTGLPGTSRTKRDGCSDEYSELFILISEFTHDQLESRVDLGEANSTFPRDIFLELGRMGVLNLPYSHVIDPQTPPVPYRVSLQVLEEIASSWLAIAVGLSVHHLACAPLMNFGTSEQLSVWQSWILSGQALGAYCLSEPHSGSDAAALSSTAVRDGDFYILNGTKSWITHGGVADFYTVFARTSPLKDSGISCFFILADTPGLEFGKPESKMALNASPTVNIDLQNVRVPVSNRIGQEGEGFAIALASLDVGRLGIAACAVGLAHSALRIANSYSQERMAFDHQIADFQGIGFMLADMATSIYASRCVYLDAAGLLDSGESISQEAAMAKLLSTDTAMAVTTNAVQVLGGNGYTSGYRAERYMREAKVLQIVEGTNQIQRVIISRELRKDP